MRREKKKLVPRGWMIGNPYSTRLGTLTIHQTEQVIEKSPQSLKRYHSLNNTPALRNEGREETVK